MNKEPRVELSRVILLTGDIVSQLQHETIFFSPSSTEENPLREYDEVLAYISRFNEFQRRVRAGFQIRNFYFWWKFRNHRKVERRLKGKSFLTERRPAERRHWDRQIALIYLEKKKVSASDEQWSFARLLGSSYPIHGLAMEIKRRFPNTDFEELAKLHKWYLDRSQRGSSKVIYEVLKGAGFALIGGAVFQVFPGFGNHPKAKVFTMLVGIYLLFFACVIGIVAVKEFFRSDRIAWIGDVINYLSLLKGRLQCDCNGEMAPINQEATTLLNKNAQGCDQDTSIALHSRA